MIYGMRGVLELRRSIPLTLSLPPLPIFLPSFFALLLSFFLSFFIVAVTVTLAVDNYCLVLSCPFLPRAFFLSFFLPSFLPFLSLSLAPRPSQGTKREARKEKKRKEKKRNEMKRKKRKEKKNFHLFLSLGDT